MASKSDNPRLINPVRGCTKTSKPSKGEEMEKWEGRKGDGVD